MSIEERTPNEENEFLLDVCPTKEDRVFTIYDITAFLPHWQGYERKRILKYHRYTIKGNKHNVLILDFWECLTEDLAKKIAKEWYLGNTSTYRLD